MRPTTATGSNFLRIPLLTIEESSRRVTNMLRHIRASRYNRLPRCMTASGSAPRSGHNINISSLTSMDSAGDASAADKAFSNPASAGPHSGAAPQVKDSVLQNQHVFGEAFNSFHGALDRMFASTTLDYVPLELINAWTKLRQTPSDFENFKTVLGEFDKIFNLQTIARASNMLTPEQFNVAEYATGVPPQENPIELVRALQAKIGADPLAAEMWFDDWAPQRRLEIKFKKMGALWENVSRTARLFISTPTQEAWEQLKISHDLRADVKQVQRDLEGFIDNFENDAAKVSRKHRKGYFGLIPWGKNVNPLAPAREQFGLQSEAIRQLLEHSPRAAQNMLKRQAAIGLKNDKDRAALYRINSEIRAVHKALGRLKKSLAADPELYGDQNANLMDVIAKWNKFYLCGDKRGMIWALYSLYVIFPKAMPGYLNTPAAALRKSKNQDPQGFEKWGLSQADTGKAGELDRLIAHSVALTMQPLKNAWLKQARDKGAAVFSHRTDQAWSNLQNQVTAAAQKAKSLSLDQKAELLAAIDHCAVAFQKAYQTDYRSMDPDMQAEYPALHQKEAQIFISNLRFYGDDFFNILHAPMDIDTFHQQVATSRQKKTGKAENVAVKARQTDMPSVQSSASGNPKPIGRASKIGPPTETTDLIQGLNKKAASRPHSSAVPEPGEFIENLGLEIVTWALAAMPLAEGGLSGYRNTDLYWESIFANLGDTLFFGTSAVRNAVKLIFSHLLVKKGNNIRKIGEKILEISQSIKFKQIITNALHDSSVADTLGTSEQRAELMSDMLADPDAMQKMAEVINALQQAQEVGDLARDLGDHLVERYHLSKTDVVLTTLDMLRRMGSVFLVVSGLVETITGAGAIAGVPKLAMGLVLQSVGSATSAKDFIDAMNVVEDLQNMRQHIKNSMHLLAVKQGFNPESPFGQALRQGAQAQEHAVFVDQFNTTGYMLAEPLFTTGYFVGAISKAMGLAHRLKADAAGKAVKDTEMGGAFEAVQAGVFGFLAVSLTLYTGIVTIGYGYKLFDSIRGLVRKHQARKEYEIFFDPQRPREQRDALVQKHSFSMLKEMGKNVQKQIGKVDELSDVKTGLKNNMSQPSTSKEKHKDLKKISEQAQVWKDSLINMRTQLQKHFANSMAGKLSQQAGSMAGSSEAGNLPIIEQINKSQVNLDDDHIPANADRLLTKMTAAAKPVLEFIITEMQNDFKDKRPRNDKDLPIKLRNMRRGLQRNEVIKTAGQLRKILKRHRFHRMAGPAIEVDRRLQFAIELQQHISLAENLAAGDEGCAEMTKLRLICNNSKNDLEFFARFVHLGIQHRDPYATMLAEYFGIKPSFQAALSRQSILTPFAATAIGAKIDTMHKTLT